jgi:spermidine synthase
MLFVSGACALAYQQLWLRMLSLVFGVTVYAAATTLASFFAGLALGSFVGGRLSDRSAHPLRWYGVAEIAIGLFAFATPALFDVAEWAYIGLHDPIADSGALLTALRLALAFIILLVPSTVMGATLPLAVRAATAYGSDVGTHAAVIYATNTAGAVLGTLLVGSWLIGTMGVAFSFRVGAALNLAVGIAALVASTSWERHDDDTDALSGGGELAPATAPASVQPTEQPVPSSQRALVLAAFTLSGFVSLALEIVWFRVLVLYMDATNHAFAIMLATVLVGIAVGSAAVTPLLRRRLPWMTTLALLEGALAVLCLLSLFLLARVYVFFDAPSTASLRFMLGASVLAILPPALLMGVAFPVGLRIWTAGGDSHEVGANVGVFYALNTAGGIAGALVAGFVLVPTIGTRSSVVLLSSLVLLSAVALAVVARRRLTVLAVAVGVGLFALLATVAVPNPYNAALEHRYPGQQLLVQDEGVQGTVSVHATETGMRELYIDGLHQASTNPAVYEFHRLIGALPLALHRDPRQVLVIGLGGGATPGAAAAQDGVHVKVVELSSSVVDAAPWFDGVNYDVTTRRNVDVVVDDGRNFLLLDDDRYDVLTADLIRPGTAGAGKLWSVEYWELARDALAPGGLMAQWVGDTRDREYRTIIRSFMEVFPETTLWHGGDLLIGSKGPLRVSRDVVERKLARAGTRQALADVGITDFEALERLYVTGPDELRDFVGVGDVLTDDKPRLEYFRPEGNEPLVDTAQIPRGGPGAVFGS